MGLLEKDNLEQYLRLNKEYGLRIKSSSDMELVIKYKSKKILDYLLQKSAPNIWNFHQNSGESKIYDSVKIIKKCIERSCYYYYTVEATDRNFMFPRLLRLRDESTFDFLNSLEQRNLVFSRLAQVRWTIDVKKESRRCGSCSTDHDSSKEQWSTRKLINKLDDSAFKKKISKILRPFLK